MCNQPTVRESTCAHVPCLPVWTPYRLKTCLEVARSTDLAIAQSSACRLTSKTAGSGTEALIFNVISYTCAFLLHKYVCCKDLEVVYYMIIYHIRVYFLLYFMSKTALKNLDYGRISSTSATEAQAPNEQNNTGGFLMLSHSSFCKMTSESQSIKTVSTVTVTWCDVTFCWGYFRNCEQSNLKKGGSAISISQWVASQACLSFILQCVVLLYDLRCDSTLNRLVLYLLTHLYLLTLPTPPLSWMLELYRADSRMCSLDLKDSQYVSNLAWDYPSVRTEDASWMRDKTSSRTTSKSC